MSDPKKIIMNFSLPPSVEDLEVLANEALEELPSELSAYMDDTEIVVDEFPPEELEDELGLESAFELLAFFKKYAEKIPGVQAKDAPEEKMLYLYRRPILDMWCESEDDLSAVVRHVMISEIAQAHDYSEDEIESLAS